MKICIFGESCVGKSTLAKALQERTNATIYTGKDYLRLAKNEAEAKSKFKTLLSQENDIIYVTTDLQDLSLLPENCVRILLTEELDIIKTRFSKRMHGQLPPPVASMLEKNHGAFDNLPYDFHFHGGNVNIDMILDK
ncbi:MAG: hypothetical protein IJB35_04740 [Oscillospiraceae bacterium]|nr:hypothetical protein [Oscillospiraceae bacterium]